MRLKHVGLLAGGIALLGAASIWGLAVSVGASSPAEHTANLPDGGWSGKVGKPAMVFHSAYGSGDGELGVDWRGETRGPDSIGVDDRERVYVLDSVNKRVVRYSEGHQDAEYPLPDTSFEDIAVSRDRFAVLSRFDDRRVLVFDADRGAVGTMAVDAKVPPVYRLFIDKGEVLVECPNPSGRTYYPIGTVDGIEASAAEQATPFTLATPLPDGNTLAAAKLGDNDIKFSVLGKGNTRKLALRSHSNRAIASIVDATSDVHGNVFVVAQLYQPGSSEASESAGRLLVAEYSSAGELIGRAETAEYGFPEPFRGFAVSEAGQLYQLVPDKHGVNVVRWNLVR